jgi:hypothetical protein
MALIVGLLCAWSILSGACVAMAIGRGDASSRTWAMATCLALAALGVPLELGCAWTASPPPPAWLLGPVLGPFRLSGTDALNEVPAAWLGLGILLSFAALAWAFAWRRIRAAAQVAAVPTDR